MWKTITFIPLSIRIDWHSIAYTYVYAVQVFEFSMTEPLNSQWWNHWILKDGEHKWANVWRGMGSIMFYYLQVWKMRKKVMEMKHKYFLQFISKYNFSPYENIPFFKFRIILKCFHRDKSKKMLIGIKIIHSFPHNTMRSKRVLILFPIGFGWNNFVYKLSIFY